MTLRYAIVLAIITLVWIALRWPANEAPVSAKPIVEPPKTVRVVEITRPTKPFQDRWEQTEPAVEVPRAQALPSPPPPRAAKAEKRGTDVCARHGRRRVEYSRGGYKYWRCQR
jgi:hypothetical protein